ncbi:MAG: OmpA family protein, partial [Bacteroidetes bacterium]|nr:OmpA family protein [Bacteroidota bacterium]
DRRGAGEERERDHGGMRKAMPYIITDACVACGGCIDSCPNNAIMIISGDVKTEKVKHLAEKYMGEEKYDKALILYLELHNKFPENIDYNYYTGLCYLNSPIEKKMAIPFFEKVQNDTSFTEENILSLYFLGQAYHSCSKFDLAISMFEKLKNIVTTKLPDGNQELIKDINYRIEMCQVGKTLINNPVKNSIVNVGKEVNSVYSEYAPIAFNNDSLLVFTSRRPDAKVDNIDKNGDYFEDIFISKKKNWSWAEAKNIDYNFLQNSNYKNTDSSGVKKHKCFSFLKRSVHHAAVATSRSEKTLFLYRSGNIISYRLNSNNVWVDPIKLGPTINNKRCRQPSITISPDENTVYFSSDRSEGEGFGGLDIYKSEKLPDGEWGPAQNLGTGINTPFDEDSPYITPDGSTLYFSSKGHNTIGGYDIFKCNKINDQWSKPENLGYPVNGSGDDVHYMESINGKHGYFASHREGSYGDMDIYMLYPEGASLDFIEVKGKVVSENDSKPLNVNIKVIDKISGKEEIFKNDTTGDYVITLSPNKKYDITYTADGFQPFSEEVSIPDQKENYQLYQKISLKQIKLNDFVVGQKMVISDVFFDIDKLVNEDDVLAKHINKTLDSIANEKYKLNNVSDSTLRLCFMSYADFLCKSQFYDKFLQRMPRTVMSKSNKEIFENITVADKSGTYTAEDKTFINYYAQPDMIANYIGVSQKTTDVFLSKPLDEILCVFDNSSDNLRKFNNLNDSSDSILLSLPCNTLNKVMTIPDNEIGNLNKVPVYVLSSICNIPDKGLKRFVTLPDELISDASLIPNDTLSKMLCNSDQWKEDIINYLNKYKTELIAINNGGNELKQLQVYFSFEHYDLPISTIYSLDSLSRILVLYPNKMILISGNADSIGMEKSNLILSQYRAMYVAGYLVAKGVKTENVRYRGLGIKNPLTSNASEIGRYLNRRVEIEIANPESLNKYNSFPEYKWENYKIVNDVYPEKSKITFDNSSSSSSSNSNDDSISLDKKKEALNTSLNTLNKLSNRIRVVTDSIVKAMRTK